MDKRGEESVGKARFEGPNVGDAPPLVGRKPCLFVAYSTAADWKCIGREIEILCVDLGRVR